MRIAMALALPLAAAACSGGNDATASRSFAASGFTSVESLGDDNVQVRSGPSFSVRAEGPRSCIDDLVVRVEGDKLRIGSQGNDWSLWGMRGATIFVTLPHLAGVRLVGSGDMDVDRGEGNFAAELTGSGDLKISALHAAETRLSIQGAGDITAGGTTARLVAAIHGSGDIDAAGLRASSADVSIAGSGDVHAQVHGPAVVQVTGSGDAELTGGAHCAITRHGSGDASCS